MGREVGYLTGSHDIPSTYERLPVFLTGAYLLDGWTRLPGFLESQYNLPAGSLYERGKLHARYQIESTKRFSGALTSAHAIPNILKRKGFLVGAHALNGSDTRYGFFVSRHKLDWGWAKEELSFQGNHSLLASGAFSGVVESRYSVAAIQRYTKVFEARHKLLARAMSHWYVHGTYGIASIAKASRRLHGRYTLPIYVRISGPWTAAHALRAAVRSRGDLEGRHNLGAFSKRSGFGNSRYDILTSGWKYGILESRYAILVDEFDEDLADDVHTWVINAKTGAPSRYKRHGFHGYASSFGGMGAASDGIYMLDGSTDDGEAIDGEIITPLYDAHQPDVGGTLLKRVNALVLGGNMDAIEVVPVLDDEDYRPFVYRRGLGVQNHKRVRIKFHKGPKTRLFQFILRNINGGSFDIESMDVEIEHLPSRER